MVLDGVARDLVTHPGFELRPMKAAAVTFRDPSSWMSQAALVRGDLEVWESRVQKAQMSQIFRPSRYLLVSHHMFELNEGQTLDDLR